MSGTSILATEQIFFNETKQSSADSIVIDLGKDHELRKLYLEHPYFIDVLRWLNGELSYEKIPHFHSEHQFRNSVLPELKLVLIRNNLLTMNEGKMQTAFRSVTFKNVPNGAGTQLVFANHIYQSLVRRSGCGLSNLQTNYLRTRASQAKVNEWKTKLRLLISEIESHESEPDGESITLCSLLVEGD